MFWALLLNSKHSGVPEDSKSPTLEVLGFNPTLGQSGVATGGVQGSQFRLLQKGGHEGEHLDQGTGTRQIQEVPEGDRHRIVIRVWGSIEISCRVNDRLTRHMIAIMWISTPK